MFYVYFICAAMRCNKRYIILLARPELHAMMLQGLCLDDVTFFHPFLADVNSRSRSLIVVAIPSVVCLSVTLVHPTQAVELFGNFFTIR